MASLPVEPLHEATHIREEIKRMRVNIRYSGLGKR